MKKIILYQIAAILLIFFAEVEGSAQQLSGTIKYQQNLNYNWDHIMKGREGDAQVKNWVETLPTDGKNVHILYFTDDEALCLEDESEKEAPSPGMQRAMHVTAMGQPPKPSLKSVYYNLKKNKKTDQMEFLTRNFLVESELENKEWKLTSEMKKILDYTCMGAEATIDDKIIKAWFTSEIPLAIGPGEFFGLPGVILAVDQNGETAFLAVSVELSPPAAELLVKPSNGKKVSQKEFDKIVLEKNEEWKKTGAGARPADHR